MLKQLIVTVTLPDTLPIAVMAPIADELATAVRASLCDLLPATSAACTVATTAQIAPDPSRRAATIAAMLARGRAIAAAMPR
jgi:hypothetical protein